MASAGITTRRGIVFGLLAVLVLGAALCLYIAADSRWRVQLLQSDPASIPSTPALARAALSRGERAFAANCAGCHGADGKGNAARGFPDLTDGDWLYGSGRVIEIEQIVLYGIRSGNSRGWNLAKMPAFGTSRAVGSDSTQPLSPRQVEDVAQYLLAFQHPELADAGAAERGGRVFHDRAKGLCWDCHGADAKGDIAIGAPDLTDAVWLYGEGTQEGIRTSIAFGRDGRCPAWTGRLSAVTVRSLAVYVYTLSHHGAAGSTAGGSADE
jgi:cytochrome c oxidase cbb3-type subunit 3